MGLMDEVSSIVAGASGQLDESASIAESEPLRLEALRERLGQEIAALKGHRGESAAEFAAISQRRTELFVQRDIHGADVAIALAALRAAEDELDARNTAIDREIRGLEEHRLELLKYIWRAELAAIEAALIEHLPAGDGLAADAVEGLRVLLQSFEVFHTWLRRTDDLLARRDNVSRALDLRLPGLPHAMGAVPLLSHLTREVLIGVARSPRSYSAALEVLERELARRTADPPTPRERTKPARIRTASDLR